MVYTNNRATNKCWYPHTNKLKYCSPETIDEHNNNFGKGWSPGSNFLSSTETSYPPKIKTSLYDHHLIKNDIFEATVKFHQGELQLVYLTIYLMAYLGLSC